MHTDATTWHDPDGNPWPVDSNITQGAGIPAADLDRLIAATIPTEAV